MTRSTTVDTRASNQWATRPADQRYMTLDSLQEAVAARKERAYTIAQPTTALKVALSEDGQDILVGANDHGDERMLTPNHWSFGQICASAGGAPASWMRKLPAPMAAINLEFGLAKLADRESSLLLGDTDGTLRAVTSPTYGRIWDIEVVDAVRRVNADGRWKVPAASYATSDPKRATTLYASDRDVFVFLVDDQHPIEVPGETQPLFRGFYTWNSEVGSATFGLATFLYERVCDNRTIWGVSQKRELTIRHTGGAPRRFEYEAPRMLREYANEDSTRVVEGVKAAQAAQIGTTNAEVMDWLSAKGFTVATAKKAVDAAVAERGGAGTVWDIVNGLTAHARTITHTDARIDLEAKAGKLMEQALKASK